MEPSFCSFCGAPLPATAKFCPKCGRTVPPVDEAAAFDDTDPYGTQIIRPPAVPEPTPAPTPQPAPPPVVTPPVAPPAAPPVPPRVTASPAPAKRSGTVLVTLAIIAAVLLIAFVLLLKMPFGSQGKLERRQAEATDTIAEGAAPNAPAPLGVEEAPAQQPTTTLQPPPGPETATTPPIVTPTPAPAPAPAPAERLSVDEAMAIVRGAAHSYYNGVTADCLSVRSEGYVNEGYTLTVGDSCNNATLGRWRVDGKTKEVFRQQDDGRYLAP